jgi:hypothetical protein
MLPAKTASEENECRRDHPHPLPAIQPRIKKRTGLATDAHL